MKQALSLAITVATLAAIPTLAAASGGELRPSRHYRRAHHVYVRRSVGREAVAPGKDVASSWTDWLPFPTHTRALKWPRIAPYPPGEGDTDGLSTNIDDCNKGCIGGQPE